MESRYPVEEEGQGCGQRRARQVPARLNRETWSKALIIHHRMLFKNTRSLLGASNRRVALPSKRCCTGRIGRRSRQPRHRESRRLLQARGAASLSRALCAGARYCACVATMMVSNALAGIAAVRRRGQLFNVVRREPVKVADRHLCDARLWPFDRIVVSVARIYGSGRRSSSLDCLTSAQTQHERELDSGQMNPRAGIGGSD